jgi:hypothetical protein
MSPAALIIAPEEDFHAQVVARRIEALGGRAFILDSALFPNEWRLAVRVADDLKPRFSLQRDRTLFLTDQEVMGIWWRRPRSHVAPEDITEKHIRDFVSYESKEAFRGWLHCFGDRVINPIGADAAASHKILQLYCASQVGLRIPRTLVTNAPSEVRLFEEEIGGSVVFKPFTGTSWQFTGTQRLTDELLVVLDTVAYSPAIFQEEVKKIGDVRVNIIDGQVFAVLITSRRHGVLLDWRVDPDFECVPHVLPSETTHALAELLARLGVRFGACDLALTEDGRYVFFEVNPGGQWLFAEIMTGQEISWAFAKALLGRTAPRHFGLGRWKAEGWRCEGERSPQG